MTAKVYPLPDAKKKIEVISGAFSAKLGPNMNTPPQHFGASGVGVGGQGEGVWCQGLSLGSPIAAMEILLAAWPPASGCSSPGNLSSGSSLGPVGEHGRASDDRLRGPSGPSAEGRHTAQSQGNRPHCNSPPAPALRPWAAGMHSGHCKTQVGG